MVSVRIRLAYLFVGLAIVFVVTLSVVGGLQGRRVQDLVSRAANRSLAAADIDRLTGLDRAKFANFIADYTWWDELANYVIKPDKQWAVDNLDSTFDAVPCEAIWVLNRKLRTVYARVRPGSRLPGSLPVSSAVVQERLSTQPFTSFWLQTPLGLAEIRGGRIHYSNDPHRTGPYTGYLVSVHLWTEKDAAQLGKTADCRIRLVASRAGTGSQNDRLSPASFRTFLPLTDYEGKTIAYLELTGTVREAAAIAAADTRLRWTLGIFAAALYGIVLLALNAWITRPLHSITQALREQSIEPVRTLLHDKGEFGPIAGVLRTAMEQREALEASEQRLQGILNTVQSGIFLVDGETHLVVDANPAMLAIAGVERDQIVGHPCHDCVCPAERGRCPVTDLGNVVDNAERTVRRPDGTEVPVLKSVKPFQVGGRTYLIESVTDITTLKRVQEELAESRQRYYEFFSLNPVPCWVYDVETLRFVDVNEAALKHYGFSRSEFLNLTVPDIRPGEDAETLRASISRETGVRHRQAVHYRTKSGRDLAVDTTSIPVVVEGRRCRLVVAYDVTERVAAEAKAEAFRQELERSNRELQDFASVASHDLQEPLRKISAFADRLVRKYADALPPEGKDYLDRVMGAVGRMQTLIEDLLTYSRVTTRARPFEPTDLNEVLHGVLSDLENRLTVSGGRVETDGLPTIEVDPMQMRQLFQNLIGNALKFRREGVPPVVRITAEELELDGRKWCKLVVADNGIGFDNQYAERIFGVFERLHGRERFEGTGMGLAIVRKIATRHGGTVTAEGKPGEGATFTIMLPVTHPEQVHAES